MVYWITGKAGSGKTTLGKLLVEHIEKAVLLDGDELRHHFPTGFGDDDRHSHIMRIAHFAAILEKQGYVPVVALMSPRKKWRQEARALFQESKLLYMGGGYLWEGTDYEEPDDEELASQYLIKTEDDH